MKNVAKITNAWHAPKELPVNVFWVEFVLNNGKLCSEYKDRYFSDRRSAIKWCREYGLSHYTSPKGNVTKL